MFLITTSNLSHKGMEHNSAREISLIFGLANGCLLSHPWGFSAFLITLPDPDPQFTLNRSMNEGGQELGHPLHFFQKCLSTTWNF